MTDHQDDRPAPAPMVCWDCGAPKPTLGVYCDCGGFTASNRMRTPGTVIVDFAEIEVSS